MIASYHPTLSEYLAHNPGVEGHGPWPRVHLVTDTWLALISRLPLSRWDLLAEWADGDKVMAAIRDDSDGAVAVLSLTTQDGRFPSLSHGWPSASRLERTIADLSGLTADSLGDTRPWLDHGTWPVQHPLGAATAHKPGALPLPYAFLPVDSEGTHQIPVGPVHAGIIEPGHFRFTCFGEAVVRLEDRLGYTHKGTETLMAGADLERAARLAGRISGDSTVAYALAFARAVEAATGTVIPPRAHWVRAVMAEMERIANHFGDIGAICNDVAFSLMHAHCGWLRERVLQAAAACFGHRLMMDRVVPGGVSCDLDDAGTQRLRDLVRQLRPRFEELVTLYDSTPSLQSRMLTAGVVQPEWVRQWGTGGFVGRATGRSFDARRSPGYEPYSQLDFTVPVRNEGDVNARVMIRIDEVHQSLSLIERLLQAMPPGPIHTAIVSADAPNSGNRHGEGVALVEGFRGDVFVSVRLNANGTIARCHLRDPSWFQWPLLMAAIKDCVVADFPLCNKSFNCSYSGPDL